MYNPFSLKDLRLGIRGLFSFRYKLVALRETRKAEKAEARTRRWRLRARVGGTAVNREAGECLKL